jgi:hypothetical protein
LHTFSLEGPLSEAGRSSVPQPATKAAAVSLCYIQSLYLTETPRKERA